MKYIDEFRNSKVSQKMIKLIHELAEKLDQDISLMEVCGTHTVAMFRHGIRNALPKKIRLISGPGCPVCVTAQEDIDRAIAVCREKNTIVTTFGDMIKVPGTISSLAREKSEGRDIRVVYSALDALEIAQRNPDKNVVHIAIGFETTIPTIAAVLFRAKKERVKNFFVLCAHKIVPPALEILVSSPKSKIDGFILPGHVSAIIGAKPYAFLPKKYKIPCVIAGFESVDILQSIIMLLKQVIDKDPRVEIQYNRIVAEKGNPVAQKAIKRVFEVRDAAWRGLGVLPLSGLGLNKDFREFDIQAQVNLKIPKQKKTACRCGDVLQGIINPKECPLFAKVCTPQNPVGPCMVSSEGACAAYYRYGRKK